jgi:predicted O-methyltransferase YrrM
MSEYELVPGNLKALIYNRKLYDVVRLSVEIGLFSRLGSPATPGSLSSGSDVAFIEYLLEALAAFGYVKKIDMEGTAYYTNTAATGLFLDRGSASYIGDDIFSGPDTYEALRKYVDKGADDTGITKAYWTPELLKNIGSFSLLGHVQDTVAHVDLSGRERMLDVGGGHGLYSIFFTKKYPGLRAWVLDLPRVVEVALDNIKKYGADRVGIIPGDFEDLRPGGTYDVVFISNVTASYEELCRLISDAMGMLTPGGALLLRNYVSDIRPGDWSALVVLDRYSRRGRKGFLKSQLRSAMETGGLADVKLIHEKDGVAILSGVAQK